MPSLKASGVIKSGRKGGGGVARTLNGNCLPSNYYPGPMLLNFSVPMGTGVSNMVNILTHT